MPILKHAQYIPKGLLRFSHYNSIYPTLFRNLPTVYHQRKRINTPDNDFFDVDILQNNDNTSCVILLHGLEGSSASQYMLGTSKILFENNYNVIAINFRSCSGELNHTNTMYHSGFTKDLQHFIEYHTEGIERIHICGFSLGGNVTLKYLAEKASQLDKRIASAIAISTPVDLRSAAVQLNHWKNAIYSARFLKTLLNKIAAKGQISPTIPNLNLLSKTKTLWAFDDNFTGPLHGMKDAEEYYQTCSTVHILDKIRVPTLIINAIDDTFLGKECYPYNQAENNQNLYLLTPKYGGHVGFVQKDTAYYWNEYQILNFIKQYP